MATSATSSETSPNHHDDDTTATISNNNKKKKKIAFMITSSMKQELQEDRLGYSAEQIKKMTPLQASLVLNHQVTAKRYDETIGVLEEKYQKEQEGLFQQEEDERLRAEEEKQQVQEQVQQQQTQEDDTNPVALPNSERNEQKQQQKYVFQNTPPLNACKRKNT